MNEFRILKEIVNQTIETRHIQKVYYSSKNKRLLNNTIKHEQKLDRMIEDYNKYLEFIKQQSDQKDFSNDALSEGKNNFY